MKIGSAHLTYCTNIHRGETWTETRAALERYLPQVKASVSPGEPMGVGLRLSAIASEELQQPAEFERFCDFLARNDLYVFTINGFPYGPFHGTRVKEDVYQPDWQTPERLAYTNRLADLLVWLLLDDPAMEGSISTVPGTFRPMGSEAGATARMADNLLAHAAHLVKLHQRTGRIIALAIEPEPMCYLETTDEAISFIETHLLANAGVARLAELTGLTMADAEAAIRRHIGLCYDVCHAAVEFEDAAGGFARLASAGLRAPKVQLSAALCVPEVGRRTVAQLERFDDGVYLHQVVERRRDGTLVRYLDLAQAFAAIDRAQGSEWRVHCHVPIFMDTLPELGTTQDMLRDVLELHRSSPLSAHLEVETYTFDVLPEELRRADVATAVSREIAWAKDILAQ